MKKESQNLLARYYNGSSSLKEEKHIKEEMLSEEGFSPEKDIFSLYAQKSAIPEGLEEDIFNVISSQNTKNRSLKVRLYSITSAAAVIIIFLSVFLNVRSNKLQAMEDQFFEMERAMFQVSESLQPEEQEEMFVLWVDENVEIIIN